MKVRSHPLTIHVDRIAYTLNAGDIAIIEARRCNAGSARRAGNARSHVMILTALRDEIAERKNWDKRTASRVLAETKMRYLYTR